jgi:hypothetical protein
MLRACLLVLALTLPVTASGETPEEWITLGTRVHGGFGSFIPLGIKIGLDAVHMIPLSALAKLGPMNKELNERERYDAVMAADGLFQVEPAP